MFSSASNGSEAKNLLKIAIIGCGQIADSVYAPILSDLAHVVRVTAVCDLDCRKASRLASARFPHAQIFSEVDSLLNNADFDGAIILSSEQANASIAKQVILNGVGAAYLEKPPASSKAELIDLMVAESESSTCIYTAFNRGHLPLFQHLNIPPSLLRRVSGRLSRVKREIASFPFTCVHLLDSAQFFGQSSFAETKIVFNQDGVSSWRLSGDFESGAAYDLIFIPDGDRESEYLIFETKDERWELQFPESDGTSPQVRLIRENKSGKKQEASNSSASPYEIMGYAPCLRDFLHHLRRGDLADSKHRLEACTRTIEILEGMQKSRDDLELA